MDMTIVVNSIRYYAGWPDKIQGKTIPIGKPMEQRMGHFPCIVHDHVDFSSQKGSLKIVREYDQEIPQSQIAEKPMAS